MLLSPVVGMLLSLGGNATREHTAQLVCSESALLCSDRLHCLVPIRQYTLTRDFELNGPGIADLVASYCYNANRGPHLYVLAGCLQGQTPLHLAAAIALSGCLKDLLQHGADVDSLDLAVSCCPWESECSCT